MADVVQDLRRRLADPHEVAAALNLLEGSVREGSGRKVRCPSHAEHSASCSLKLRADGTLSAHCFGCDWSADVLGLVAKVRGLDLARDFRRVLEEAARLAGVSLVGEAPPPPRPTAPAAPAAKRPPLAELRALWRAGEPVDATGPAREEDLAVSRFLSRRGWWPPRALDALKIARVLPLEHDFPAWWPASWAPRWRLAVLAYEPDGTPASLHARSVDPAADGRDNKKTLWPLGCAAAGLLFACVRGRQILLCKGNNKLAGVLVVEGLTDFLAAALACASAPYAVLGATSGGFPALAGVRWPADLPAVVAVDQDAAGERYVAEIRRALPGRRLLRWRPGAAA